MDLYVGIVMDVNKQQQFMDLYASIVMDVKKSTIKPICEYYNGCKKTSNYLWDLYAGITMDVKKPTIIYETYMWVLHIWNGL